MGFLKLEDELRVNCYLKSGKIYGSIAASSKIGLATVMAMRTSIAQKDVMKDFEKLLVVLEY